MPRSDHTDPTVMSGTKWSSGKTFVTVVAFAFRSVSKRFNLKLKSRGSVLVRMLTSTESYDALDLAMYNGIDGYT